MLRALAHFASPGDANAIRALASDEAHYRQFVVNEYRGLFDIVRVYPSLQGAVPWPSLLSIVPRLQVDLIQVTPHRCNAHLLYDLAPLLLDLIV